MFFRIVLTGREAVTTATASLLEALKEDGTHEVIVQPWEPPGSDKQLRGIYTCYADLARAMPEYDAQGWRRFCKYHVGVPILIREPEHEEVFREVLGRYPMPQGYEKRLQLMDYLDVVSVMNRAQRREYLDGIMKHPRFEDVRWRVKEGQK